MVLQSDWKQIAENLELDKSTRVYCCTAKEKTLSVHRVKTGATAYCFRCGYRAFHSIRGIHVPPPVVQEDVLRKYVMPPDAIDVPEDKVDWLVKYGITPSERVIFGIKYSPKEDRIVLPVFDRNNTLIASVSRRLNNDSQCKYLTRTVTTGAIFSSVDRLLPSIEGNPFLFITEDIISAIKVGRQVPCVSLLGTGISDSKIVSIKNIVANLGKTGVVLWLDNDQAGYNATKKFRAKWELMSDIPIYTIKSFSDPKTYSGWDIGKFVFKILGELNARLDTSEIMSPP